MTSLARTAAESAWTWDAVEERSLPTPSVKAVTGSPAGKGSPSTIQSLLVVRPVKVRKMGPSSRVCGPRVKRWKASLLEYTAPEPARIASPGSGSSYRTQERAEGTTSRLSGSRRAWPAARTNHGAPAPATSCRGRSAGTRLRTSHRASKSPAFARGRASAISACRSGAGYSRTSGAAPRAKRATVIGCVPGPEDGEHGVAEGQANGGRRPLVGGGESGDV